MLSPFGYPIPGNAVDLPDYVTNDSAPSTVASGTRYQVPKTAAAATVTLPHDAPDGAIIVVCGDGKANKHTVTLRDAGTGAPVPITAALAANKAFAALCIKNAGAWIAIVGAAP